MENETLIKDNRRAFLRKTISSCAFCCVAVPIAFGSDRINSITSDQKHKFQTDSGMTMQQVYNFAYKQWYIPAMKNLRKQIGKELFLEMLKKSSEMLYETDKNAPVNYNERTLTAFADDLKKSAEGFYKLRNTFEFMKSDEYVLELKCTECIWAKTFREADATDIGYAGCCYQDYPMAKQYNPNLKLIREKTLMQGNDCCHFKWIMET